MQKETLLIVGAGISGLTLALELAGKYSITILEAASHPGGRIHSIKDNNFPITIEAGPEFIHGHLKHTFRFLKEAGIESIPVKGKMYRKKSNRWVQEEEMIEGWDKLMHQMKELPDDTTLDNFLQIYFSEDRYSELRSQAISYAEGFDLADTKKASVKALYKEWNNEEHTNFRIPIGYSALINYIEKRCIEKGCNIIYGQTVKQIDWQEGSVTAYTADNLKYETQKIAITVPVSLLQTSNAGATAAIHFNPALDRYTAAANDIGFGSLIKLHFLFKERFWRKDTGFVISEEVIRTWWTQLPDTSLLLTGWAGGPRSEELKLKTIGEIIEIGLISLSNIYSLPLQQLQNNLAEAKVFNWQQNPLALGAYSYPTPQTAAAVDILNMPVADTVFFCGEATCQDESPGTVEAAIISAFRLAKKMK